VEDASDHKRAFAVCEVGLDVSGSQLYVPRYVDRRLALCYDTGRIYTTNDDPSVTMKHANKISVGVEGHVVEVTRKNIIEPYSYKDRAED
jgi:hypothetical protein